MQVDDTKNNSFSIYPIKKDENSFIEENNLEGKKIYIYVTSGGSSSEKSINDLRNKYPNLNFLKSIRLKGNEEKEIVNNWIDII